MKIKLSLISPSPNPVRKTWDEDALNDLANSIKRHGLIVPIKVQPAGEGYQVIYGHRRVEAAKRAKLKEVEAIVEGLTDLDALLQATIENVNREQMNVIEEAQAVREIREMSGWSYRKMQTAGIGSRSHITRLLQLVDLPNDLQEDLSAGRISPKHVELVRKAKLPDKSTYAVLRQAGSEKMSAQSAGKFASEYTPKVSHDGTAEKSSQANPTTIVDKENPPTRTFRFLRWKITIESTE